MKQLNVGCGDWPRPGWINLDIHDGAGQRWKPDVVADVLELPFDERTFDRVYLGHVLEHIELDHLGSAMSEVFRVLKRNGRVVVVGPDVEKVARLEPAVMSDSLHGGQRWPGDEHLWDSTATRTVRYLEKAGFHTEEISMKEVSDLGFPLVSEVAWQFALVVSE